MDKWFQRGLGFALAHDMLCFRTRKEENMSYVVSELSIKGGNCDIDDSFALLVSVCKL